MRSDILYAPVWASLSLPFYPCGSRCNQGSSSFQEQTEADSATELADIRTESAIGQLARAFSRGRIRRRSVAGRNVLDEARKIGQSEDVSSHSSSGARLHAPGPDRG